MKRADKRNARYVLIAGQAELDDNALILRNMQTKEQVSIPMDRLKPDIIALMKTE